MIKLERKTTKFAKGSQAMQAVFLDNSLIGLFVSVQTARQFIEVNGGEKTHNTDFWKHADGFRLYHMVGTWVRVEDEE